MNRRGFLKSCVVAAGAVRMPLSFGSEAQDPGIVRYPDPWIETIDARFSVPFNAAVERLWTGARWAEGPL